MVRSQPSQPSRWKKKISEITHRLHLVFSLIISICVGLSSQSWSSLTPGYTRQSLTIPPHHHSSPASAPFASLIHNFLILVSSHISHARGFHQSCDITHQILQCASTNKPYIYHSEKYPLETPYPHIKHSPALSNSRRERKKEKRDMKPALNNISHECRTKTLTCPQTKILEGQEKNTKLSPFLTMSPMNLEHRWGRPSSLLVFNFYTSAHQPGFLPQLPLLSLAIYRRLSMSIIIIRLMRSRPQGQEALIRLAIILSPRAPIGEGPLSLSSWRRREVLQEPLPPVSGPHQNSNSHANHPSAGAKSWASRQSSLKESI